MKHTKSKDWEASEWAELNKIVKRIISFGEMAEASWTVPKTNKHRKQNREYHATQFTNRITHLLDEKTAQVWAEAYEKGKQEGKK